MSDEDAREALLEHVLDESPGARKPISLWDWAERNGYEPEDMAAAVDALGSALNRGMTAMCVWYDDIDDVEAALKRRRATGT